jgi:uncharacterized membrane protein (DUF485 family)
MGKTQAHTPKETSMETDLAARIAAHPTYQKLKTTRSTLGWWLTGAMMLVYYGFIVLVAYFKPLMSTRIGEGVTTWGMPVGLFVIAFTIVITGIYVRRANDEFDRLAAELNKAVMK